MSDENFENNSVNRTRPSGKGSFTGWCFLVQQREPGLENGDIEDCLNQQSNVYVTKQGQLGKMEVVILIEDIREILNPFIFFYEKILSKRTKNKQANNKQNR